MYGFAEEMSAMTGGVVEVEAAEVVKMWATTDGKKGQLLIGPPLSLGMSELRLTSLVMLILALTSINMRISLLRLQETKSLLTSTL
jgi:hypothetical protein